MGKKPAIGKGAPIGPQAIVFDAAGTLVRPAEPVAETYSRLAKACGIDLASTIIEARFGAARTDIFPSSGDLVSSETIERRRWQMLVERVFGESSDLALLFDTLWHYFARPDAWVVFEDVPVALELVAAGGLSTAIASNFDHRLKDICAGHRVLAAMPVFCSTDAGFSKPDERFFRFVERNLGIPPSRLMMVGDDLLMDIAGAQSAGWRAARIDREKVTLDQLLRDTGALDRPNR